MKTKFYQVLTVCAGVSLMFISCITDQKEDDTFYISGPYTKVGIASIAQEYEIDVRGQLDETDIDSSDQQKSYIDYSAPWTSGFKSYMSYDCITAVGSSQYKLQNNDAYTGDYGIRQVDGRYCVAIGSYFTSEIGTLFDLVLKNGTVIPCILADQKADEDTDAQNIITVHNGCMTEFVVDIDYLHPTARRMGDISYCNEDWNSPVDYVRVYIE